MKIQRTANAGVLVETNGVRLLFDGVCMPLYPYEGTPDSLKSELLLQSPDAVMYTHYHSDHYDEDFSMKYKTKTLRPVYGPECPLYGEIGGVGIKSFKTRHIGKSDVSHISYAVEGEKNIWFMGDSSPLAVKNINEQKPHILIVPYAFVITKSAWEITKSQGAERIILLHMPKEENDIHNLWQMLRDTVGDLSLITIPKMGEVTEF